ncbi:hypothetical protein C8Q77DRAFT_192232 [Trametes polyzona]|nr:hypothetical protein C8Q77DRAFT_192232 [Trametes polyzona]
MKMYEWLVFPPLTYWVGFPSARAFLFPPPSSVDALGKTGRCSPAYTHNATQLTCTHIYMHKTMGPGGFCDALASLSYSSDTQDSTF